MNIVSWNVRGLERSAKQFLVKDFLALHFADLCCLQEYKLEEIQLSTWKEIGGVKLDQFNFLLARGSASGIILGWNPQATSGRLTKMGEFSILVDFCSNLDGFY
ncbi:Exodeoxyribonuclease III protein [Dioscorea alata]|uniref:Exodeoxyribonuclease III protein n=1 Tax=Dioscorea alata TaxID=55571 RepID=A0ACB7WP24_DIOAL|nr:Exodeoxyribonuclease III protein [Dioscorea alata]